MTLINIKVIERFEAVLESDFFRERPSDIAESKNIMGPKVVVADSRSLMISFPWDPAPNSARSIKAENTNITISSDFMFVFF